MELPSDIIPNILSRLEMKDVMQCRSVCKNWNNLTRESSFADLHTSRGRMLPSQPCCLIHGIEDNSLFLINAGDKTALGREIRMHNLELKSGYRIVGSYNGLLCMASNSMSDPVLIYNPVTKEAIRLPENDSNNSTTEVIYGFGFDQVSNTYKVVCVCCPDYSDPDYDKSDPDLDLVTQCEIITIGESSWRKLEVPSPLGVDYWNETIFSDGFFHWRINSDHNSDGAELILALDIKEEKFHTIYLPPMQEPKAILYIANLADSLVVVDGTNLNKSSSIWHILRRKFKNEWDDGFVEEKVHGTKGFGFYEEFTGNNRKRIMFCGFSGEVVGKLSNGAILYKIPKQYTPSTKDRLALYVPCDRRCSFLEMSGLPCSFKAHMFVPSLVSPCAILSSSEKKMKTTVLRDEMERRRKRTDDVCSVDRVRKIPKMC